jgi:excisionase family DNA binding protein
MVKHAIVDLYTVTETALLLGMGRSTLYRLIRAGRVTYTLDPAGRVRFTSDDIRDNLRAGHRPAVAA